MAIAELLAHHDASDSDHDGTKYCRPCSRWSKDHASVPQHLIHSNALDYCERCDREFVNHVAKSQHIADSSGHNICHLQVCRNYCSNGADFPAYGALLDHFRDDKNHHYCFSCKSDFDSDQKLNSHFKVSSNHHWCTRCSRDFISDVALLQHWQSSSLHFLCGICKRDFSNTNELVQVHFPPSPLDLSLSMDMHTNHPNSTKKYTNLAPSPALAPSPSPVSPPSSSIGKPANAPRTGSSSTSWSLASPNTAASPSRNI